MRSHISTFLRKWSTMMEHVLALLLEVLREVPASAWRKSEVADTKKRVKVGTPTRYTLTMTPTDTEQRWWEEEHWQLDTEEPSPVRRHQPFLETFITRSSSNSSSKLTSSNRRTWLSRSDARKSD